jgi:hypothetical protein
MSSRRPFLGRTDQLDSGQLDSELTGLMTSRIAAAFQYFGPGSNPLDRFGPDLDLALKFILVPML